MAVQYIDWRVSCAQGALPAQIVVKRWFTAGAYAAASSNTPARPPPPRAGHTEGARRPPAYRGGTWHELVSPCQWWGSYSD
jgi:hypothetical protein